MRKLGVMVTIMLLLFLDRKHHVGLAHVAQKHRNEAPRATCRYILLLLQLARQFHTLIWLLNWSPAAYIHLVHKTIAYQCQRGVGITSDLYWIEFGAHRAIPSHLDQKQQQLESGFCQASQGCIKSWLPTLVKTFLHSLVEQLGIIVLVQKCTCKLFQNSNSHLTTPLIALANRWIMDHSASYPCFSQSKHLCLPFSWVSE